MLNLAYNAICDGVRFHEGAAAEADQVIALCRQAGFRKIVIRGDTAFSQSEKLDVWDEDGVSNSQRSSRLTPTGCD